MNLTFLGTGAAMPTGDRMQTGLLVENGEDRLLIDCGSGVLHRLAQTETGYEGVETLLLTHHHLDHISDIPVLLKARWLAGSDSLRIVGPPGTRQRIEQMLAVHEYMQEKVEVSFQEIEPGAACSLAGFELESMETEHSMQCLAYRVRPQDSQQPLFVFSGDSEASTDLIEFADGAALLVHDCSFPDEVDVSNHPTPASLGATLAEGGADIGRVYLTHLYPHTDGNHEEMLDSLTESYDGDVRFARDGMSVEISQ